jgi:hypothetical protein
MSLRQDPPELRKRIDSVLTAMEELRRPNLSAFHEPRFNLGAITGSLGIPEAKIRNWLTRDQLPLSAKDGHQKGKWRLFSNRDAIVIAVAHHLSLLGVPMAPCTEVSVRVAEAAQMLFQGAMGLPKNMVLIVFNDGEWKIARAFDSGPFRISEMDIPPAAIVVNVHKVIMDTLRPLGIEIFSGNKHDFEKRREELDASEAAQE